MFAQSFNFSSLSVSGRMILAIAGLLLLTSCLGYPQARQGAVEPLEAELQTLALLRTTWDGTRPDGFCQPDIGDAFQAQMKQSLQALGYRVVDFRVPPLENSFRPDPVADWSGTELRQHAPEAVDGVFRLRIVEYLDAALCDRSFEMKSLDIAAVAEIFARKDGRLLWQTRQQCGDISGSTETVVYNCSVGLSQRIAAQLPPAGR